MGAPMHDYMKCMPKEMWTRLIHIAAKKDHNRAIGEVCFWASTVADRAYLQPATSMINVCLDAAEISYYDLWKQTLGTPHIAKSHLSILNKIQSLNPSQVKRIKDLMTDLVTPWYTMPNVTGCHNPSGRLYYLVEHKKTPMIDFLVAQKGAETAFDAKPAAPEDRLIWAVRFRDRVRAWSEVNKWIVNNVFFVAENLDISPKWILGLPDNANFWGLTPEQESLFDLWSLLPDYGRCAIDRLCDLLQGKEVPDYDS